MCYLPSDSLWLAMHGKTISVVIVYYIKCKLFLSHRKGPSETVLFSVECLWALGGAVFLWDESVCNIAHV